MDSNDESETTAPTLVESKHESICLEIGENSMSSVCDDFLCGSSTIIHIDELSRESQALFCQSQVEHPEDEPWGVLSSSSLPLQTRSGEFT